MNRPEFLNCPMTSNIISRIRDEQSAYDKDPEGYERREREHKERIDQEVQAEEEYYRNQVE